MSYKLTCPNCDTHTSANFRAYEDGRKCPSCGGSLQAASEQYYRQLPDLDSWDGRFTPSEPWSEWALSNSDAEQPDVLRKEPEQ